MSKFDQSPGQDLPVYTVATAPTPSTSLIGQMIYVSNGGAGSPVIAFCDGTNWLRCDAITTAIAIA